MAVTESERPWESSAEVGRSILVGFVSSTRSSSPLPFLTFMVAGELVANN